MALDIASDWEPPIVTRESPTSAEPSDAALVAALAEDPAALAGLYDRHAALVYGLALKVLASPTEAEDLTQEIFVTLRQASTFDPTRGTLSAYLVTLTRSRAIDRLRARGRSRRLLEQWNAEPTRAAAAPSPLDALALRERTEHVRAALAALPETQRTVLELAYFRGLSQTEIATELDTPLGTVKTWARKGLSALRALLGERMA
jgi:RNA polymerase sigma-70 factor (ECF subfamily)